ncbi:MAG TPA: DinB family protein [Thermoanaerobaculia bacterium]|nr:DinB family protein [Thermoanaerobaculia bacterium]
MIPVDISVTNADVMKKKTSEAPQDDLRPHYDFDYAKMKPNRFAGEAKVYKRTPMDQPQVTELLNYFERVRERTMRVVACIPPERVDWTYREGKFTLGDLMRHLASIERWMFAENAQRKASRYPGHGIELADGYDTIVAFMRRMHEESMAIFGALTDGDLEQKCVTPGGAALRIGKWLRLMIEHEIHHRGQIYLYLAMLGIETPPLYGLTEEEVKRRSG